MTLLKGVTVSFVRTAACNPGSAGAGTSAPLCWLPLLSHTFTCSALSHDLLPPQKSQSCRTGSPAPAEGAGQRVRLCNKERPPSRATASAESPAERSRGQAGRRRGGDVPPPLRREVISHLGSLLWMLGSSEAGSPETRSASGAPLAGLAANHALSARRRRSGWGPGRCTQRGAEPRGGEAEPSPAGSPRPEIGRAHV